MNKPRQTQRPFSTGTPGEKVAAGRMRGPSDADTKAARDSYFGGKGGCFRQLVNQIPPHRTLVIPFAGHCAVTCNMRLPEAVWINDTDQDVFRWWNRCIETLPVDRSVSVTQYCGIEILESLRITKWSAPPVWSAPEVTRSLAFAGPLFIYCDPTYLHSTRKSESRYPHELTDAQHVNLLAAVKQMPRDGSCNVMLSGYDSWLYRKALTDWRHYSFQSTTRSGTATEHVWCNYDQPTQLQDYRYLGRTKRERFKLLRRHRNVTAKLRRLPTVERNALLMAIASEFGNPADE